MQFGLSEFEGKHPQARRAGAFSVAFRGLSHLSIWFLVGLLLCPVGLMAQSQILSDKIGDEVIRRTDDGNDGVVDAEVNRMPDLIEIRLGRFKPPFPHVDRFDGLWDSTGPFMRLDLVFCGLINPPGMLEFADSGPVYDPMLYGPNPVFGFLEIDVDNDVNTGGELDTPELRYNGNTSRFGGFPAGLPFVNRVAFEHSAFDGNVTTLPLVDRSGEEFHLALLGEEVISVTVLQEKVAGNPAIFEEGEIWDVDGTFFHRAHGFEAFSFSCVANPGPYSPEVRLRFQHDVASDTTTISLIYPITQIGAAALIGPSEPVEPEDGCPSNQYSIHEALVDLQFSAQFMPEPDRSSAQFQLIAGWEFLDPSLQLDTAAWRSTALFGSAYESEQADNARFVWTDIFPNVKLGDFNGDDCVTVADATALIDLVNFADSNPLYDEDGLVNGIIDIPQFASNFGFLDTNYDGFIDIVDIIVPGDLNGDQVVNVIDLSLFVILLLDPVQFQAMHPNIDPLLADFNCDGKVDGLDIQGYTDWILPP